MVAGSLMIFASLPAGTDYKLQSYGMGSGGVADASSSQYRMEAISGEQSGLQMSGSVYSAGTGFITVEQANVPASPSLTNPGNRWYNKLQLIIDTGSNPTDTTFAVAISTDDFVTTQYVQSDSTVGPVLGIEDYRTYAGWGSGTGMVIAGLQPDTEYKVKVRAMQGVFTESGYSAPSAASTVNLALSFDIDVSTTDSETSAPYDLGFTDLLPNTVIDSTERIWFDFDTNGENGGNIYAYGENNGLQSSRVSHTIAAVSGDLSALAGGFGARSNSATQVSGGPFSPVAPYAGTSDTIGLMDTAIRRLFTSSAPTVDGRSSLILKAKVDSTVPASNDYAEVLTFIAAPSY